MDIKFLESIRTDRWIGTTEDSRAKLYGISNSSQLAYGVVVYARTEYANSHVSCRLLISKSRAAPLKPMTISRLGLAAAELLSRQIVEVEKSMEFPGMKYILFTDTSPEHYWIRRDPANLKVYASNRVDSIQRHEDLKS